MNIFLSLCILGVLLAKGTSECPPLRHTNGIMTVKIDWRYDMWDYKCQANQQGSDEVTSFAKGEKKSLAGLDNDCLLFLCDFSSKTVILDTEASSCVFKSKCTSKEKYGQACNTPYNCLTAVYEMSASYNYTDMYRYRYGWFSLVTGYTCGRTGSGPCKSDQCFNPFADPKRLSTTRGPACVAVGGQVVNPANQAFLCKKSSACSSNSLSSSSSSSSPSSSSSYVDLELEGIGCDANGTFVPAGNVTWSDPCSHTVCTVQNGVGTLVTSFKDKAGCVYEDRCVTVETGVRGTTEFTCAVFECRYDPDLDTPYYLDIIEEGCYYENKCYEAEQNVKQRDACRKLFCAKDQDSNTFYWKQELTGCYDKDTGQCLPDKARQKVDKCQVDRCLADDFGRWKAEYKKSGSCAPRNTECEKPNGLKGCKHKGKCYAVKSVLTFNPCVQYVCYSDDADLNSGTVNKESPSPAWKARATGCLGPTGCMAFGEQYLDPNTNNTYRCDYLLGGFGVKRAQFHQACVAPNGQTLPVGQSVLIGTVWYSCYRGGVIKNPIDRSIIYVPDDHNHTCGRNPDTGRWLYKAEYYYTPVGRCKKTGFYCLLNCQYFDQPCTHTDVTPYRYIGHKFILNGAECACTQDYEVNNKLIPSTGSLFNTPSLCGQDQVRDAACKDPVDDSLHQWGELWERSRGSKICTCHPLLRQAFCSTYLPDVTKVLTNMKI